MREGIVQALASREALLLLFLLWFSIIMALVIIIIVFSWSPILFLLRSAICPIAPFTSCLGQHTVSMTLRAIFQVGYYLGRATGCLAPREPTSLEQLYLWLSRVGALVEQTAQQLSAVMGRYGHDIGYMQ